MSHIGAPSTLKTLARPPNCSQVSFIESPDRR
jgi:hypothetical protein